MRKNDDWYILQPKLKNEKKIYEKKDHYRFLVGGTLATDDIDLPIDNPAPYWLPDRAWQKLRELYTLPIMQDIIKVADIENRKNFLRTLFDSPTPETERFPPIIEETSFGFYKLLLIQALRPDKLTNTMQNYVASHLGQKFIEPQTAELSLVFRESSPKVPLIFILSVGTDPAEGLYKFAEEANFSKKLTAISLGQGQGPRAEAMMQMAMERGQWVFFQNCHLAPSWMPTLERLVENIDPNMVHKDFRLWLTSMPSPKFPVAILQNGSKLTIEPPRGIKANLLRSYLPLNDDELNSCVNKSDEFKRLLFSLCLFHAVTLERRKFGALGFNIPYEFTDGDLRICISQLKMFLTEYEDVPFKVLIYTAGHINYGGRVTDDRDRRCIMNILADFYSSKVVMEDGYTYDDVGRNYFQLASANAEHMSYMLYIKNLPLNDTPEIFGLHDNANITYAENEAFRQVGNLLELEPKSTGSAGQTPEEILTQTINKIQSDVPPPFPVDDIMKDFPVKYEESMNTVLVQEVIRYNSLLKTILRSTSDLIKALKGLVVMSSQLEQMSNSLSVNAVPVMWAKKAYPSLKPLGAWIVDLKARIRFLEKWIEEKSAKIYWISGFYFPQAFLTGTLQNYARKYQLSIDTIAFDFDVMTDENDRLEPAVDGCYINGLFLEGARWDSEQSLLVDSRPKKLFTEMATIWLRPQANRLEPEGNHYNCPVYKTLTRAGTLSTTGQSTNYVLAIDLAASKEESFWIKRGVALLCALDY
ncbi:hypothetical protein SNEBB_005934 [Seison nebaliae]|nr:hypothetical protein SNEBB_005934 [Seison nebaliae]